MQNDTKKLDQLTSLRFFAALLIVIHHSVGSFGIKEIHGTPTMKKSWQDHFTISRNTFIAGLTLSCIIGLVYIHNLVS